MKCTKTMLVTGGVMLAALTAAYFALPQVRAVVVSAGPFLLLLLCPLSMFFMMKGMSSHGDHHSSADDSDRRQLHSSDSHLKR
ncbi:DUF2933 domain-containing protein [Burkholderia pseudomultivorans]|uniref:DUF2933 domain-containing protein n=1 Tax=Burkholderia pseudomultivorans TaxID=1207504 RepID=UPI00188E93F5|nr:DUF2933 domain-containing protein [Burkholderia pseudomultivorans]MBF5008714.1 DUF2933 domain-containing protein [Burkholderia pseudomultivorans]